MADVKWIKIVTDFFENEKIDYIFGLPEADALIVIWIRLLTLAGASNNDGYIMLNEDIAYDDEMLAHKCRKPVNLVRSALKIFEKLKMIIPTDNGYRIKNWEKYQNIEGLEKIRLSARLRQKRHREKEKTEVLPCHVTDNVTVFNKNNKKEDVEEKQENGNNFHEKQKNTKPTPNVDTDKKINSLEENGHVTDNVTSNVTETLLNTDVTPIEYRNINNTTRARKKKKYSDEVHEVTEYYQKKLKEFYPSFTAISKSWFIRQSQTADALLKKKTKKEIFDLIDATFQDKYWSPKFTTLGVLESTQTILEKSPPPFTSGPTAKEKNWVDKQMEMSYEELKKAGKL